MLFIFPQGIKFTVNYINGFLIFNCNYFIASDFAQKKPAN